MLGYQRQEVSYISVTDLYLEFSLTTENHHLTKQKVKEKSFFFITWRVINDPLKKAVQNNGDVKGLSSWGEGRELTSTTTKTTGFYKVDIDWHL
jgi:hypothetical protein